MNILLYSNSNRIKEDRLLILINFGIYLLIIRYLCNFAAQI